MNLISALGMTGSKPSNSTDNEFDDISSFSSIDSYKPQAFTGFEGEQENVQDHDDTLSRASSNTLRRPNSNAIEKVVTKNAVNDNVETKESLQKEGLDLKNKPIPDINAPVTAEAGDSVFPEEYRLETETGLVKLKTLDDLSRKNTRVSIGSDGRMSRKSSNKENASTASKNGSGDVVLSDETPYDAHNIHDAVEKNKHEIEKYQKHKHEKGLKGFVHRLFD